jgi:phage-related protein
MNREEKSLVWLRGEIKTPPFSQSARLEAGYLLRKLQMGEMVSMPQSRPMTSICSTCHELRINDKESIWRIIYRIDEDAIILLHIFQKKTRTTPQNIINLCKDRIKLYNSIIKEGE